MSLVRLSIFAVMISASWQSAMAADDCTIKHSFVYCIMNMIGMGKGLHDESNSGYQHVVDGEIKSSGKSLGERAINVALSAGSIDKISSSGYPGLNYIFFANFLINTAVDVDANFGKKHQMFAIQKNPSVAPIEVYQDLKNSFLSGLRAALDAESFEAVEDPGMTGGSGYLFKGGRFCGELGCIVKSRLIFHGEKSQGRVIGKIHEPPFWFGGKEAYLATQIEPGVMTVNGVNQRIGTKLSWEQYVVLMKNLDDRFYAFFPGGLKKPAILINDQSYHQAIEPKQ